MAIVTSLLFLIAIVLQTVESKYMEYDTSAEIVPGKLNVHLVAHSHDDVGWLKTVDQYYVGTNGTIQAACVQDILDSLIPALLADKNRKFIYVEQAFFQRWWRQQSQAIQSITKQFISSGQLEFINGGMCMHDEAAPHYIDMIDQTTLGHRFIKQEFDLAPRIGWQIDPFGHSAVQAYLLGAEVGFDSLFFGRIDYQDRAKRYVDKSLEVVWQGSKSLGSSAQIFAGAFPSNYEPPSGFYYEVNDGSRDIRIVQDDIDLFDYNVQKQVDDFVAAALAQANITRTNHIMWTMGTDFQYQYATTWFRNMDKLIHYVNQDGRINALYSTPSIYTDAKHAANEYWPLKTDDYFPYADRVNAYWTGYFTSRPGLKGYVRVMSAYYLAARQLEFFIGRSKTKSATDSLADALAIAQHHDAVSGTSKQHVANDYSKRLYIGYKEAKEVVAASFARLTESAPRSGYKALATEFQECPLLNISYCPATEVNISHGKKLTVVVYNPLGWKREDIVKIPVISDNVIVQDSTGKEVESQFVPLVNTALRLRNYYAAAYVGESPSVTPKYWLAFKATVPPLGFNTYTITSSKGTSRLAKKKPYKLIGSQNETVEVGPGALKLVYSADGGLSQYINKETLVNETIKQSYKFYSSYDGSQDHEYFQASGAYVFRPNGTYPVLEKKKISLNVYRGPLYDEVHQRINSWIYQITRVYKDKDHAEFEFTVGPIPIDDGIGKEVATQISTTLKTNKIFYTDSSGRDFMKRVRDYRADWTIKVDQPIAGNYYPINLGIYSKDDNNELSILVDRSVGGSSIEDGQLELMLHRRLLHDDSRGVAEALNETVCALDECYGLTVQGKYYARIDPLGGGAAKWRRSYGQELYSPLLLAFAEQDGNKGIDLQKPIFSGFESSYSLPENVALITLQELEDEKVLLRLAHLYEVGEDKDLSVKATVELKNLFQGRQISDVKEMSLSGNQERDEMLKNRLVWKVEGSKDGNVGISRGSPLDSEELVVELYPMEIRTFLVDLDHREEPGIAVK
ncbi:probable alpha-mannosidase At5g13980 isoform X2 [Impatiens glandulifera]|uniref:probable alpha-mannosidase At5g13980 isoform X2 n=1 Tax=Impatiens glandulifera TaxID=253017 RepID=UPI001FB12086|nr:probable alpha-mannosidase At5g13980 isoform X2 [Impatiens glandulifera]